MHPIADLQIEYSLISRGIEAEILPALRELGIGVTAYGVLSRGLLSGHWSRERALDGDDFRATCPRFSGENLDATWRWSTRCARSPPSRARPSPSSAIAWVLARGDDIVPLIGARTPRPARRGPRRARRRADAGRPRPLEAAVPADAVAGDRYDAAQMAHARQRALTPPGVAPRSVGRGGALSAW